MQPGELARLLTPRWAGALSRCLADSSGMDAPLRIVVAEPDKTLRSALQLLLAHQEDLVLVGEATTHEELQHLLDGKGCRKFTSKPDVVEADADPRRRRRIRRHFMSEPALEQHELARLRRNLDPSLSVRAHFRL